jgi:hypothetical protein
VRKLLDHAGDRIAVAVERVGLRARRRGAGEALPVRSVHVREVLEHAPHRRQELLQGDRLEPERRV